MSFIHCKPLSAEWFAARAGKITASSAASILVPGEAGVYGTPLSEFARVKREMEGKAVDEMADFENDANEEDNLEEEERNGPLGMNIERADLAWGNATEALHRDMLAKAAKCSIAPCEGLFVHPSLPWLAATPDGLAYDDQNGNGLCELKAPTQFGLAKWEGDQPPMGYLVQVSVAMMCAEKPWDLLSVLVPPKPRWRRTFLSPEMEEFILNGLRDFWENHVMRDVPPDAMGNDKDLAALKALYPQSTTRRIVFSMAAIDAAQALEDAKAAKKDIEAQEKEAKAILLAELGDAEAGILPDGTGYTYKTQVQQREAKPATTLEFRVLRKVKKL